MYFSMFGKNDLDQKQTAVLTKLKKPSTKKTMDQTEEEIQMDQAIQSATRIILTIRECLILTKL